MIENIDIAKEVITIPLKGFYDYTAVTSIIIPETYKQGIPGLFLFYCYFAANRSRSICKRLTLILVCINIYTYSHNQGWSFLYVYDKLHIKDSIFPQP